MDILRPQLRPAPVILRSCPRCRGAVIVRAFDGRACVNCGWRPVRSAASVIESLRPYSTGEEG